ncbi:hypothetical protein [Trinickia mobilis]|uniref:hypothetical protein n=1 Tax=Trinickia mobilis TaxID=2816356 RepID=UPI001A8EFF41|nr:hypothetical protein [Trinickia mobilis]
MIERPILFSGPMVRAILDGRKTQTRRVVKGFALELLHPDNFTPEYVALPENDLSPYGYAGDHLWVKETFVAFGRWETRYSEEKGRDEWHFVDMTVEAGFAYRFDGADPDARRRAGAAPTWHTRPSIFMPRAASRITLENAGVRVERLNSISEADAIAEGIERHYTGWRPYTTMFYEADGVTPANYLRDPRDSYRQLWDSLNAARGYGWDVNPWVWVVEFRRVQ